METKHRCVVSVFIIFCSFFVDCLFYLPPTRLVLSRFEIEAVTIGEAPVETEEDEEEVWLFWRDNLKEIRSKSVRELAQDAKEGQKEDQEVVSYYRSGIRALQGSQWVLVG